MYLQLYVHCTSKEVPYYYYSWMLQHYHATHGSSHALNLFYINSLDQMQQSRGGPNKDTIYSTTTS